ncbi:MAG: RluA family pseudouridine synthase [Alphaproteobacteria bacterium]|nr:RluA family pseudouridine synthase [Alphaproteobacteria bacterium]
MRQVAGVFAPEHAEERLDRALVAALGAGHPTLTRSRLKSLIEGRHVRIEGATVSEPSRRVKPGQRFELDLPAPSAGTIEAQAMELAIVHEDDDLIVVDKPAGMVVHPAAGNPDRTLVNALLAHCGDSLRVVGGTGRPGIVHRLDKDTSGLIVAAKTEVALLGLARQFAEHSVDRVYEALVWGLPSPTEGEIAGAIGRSHADRKKMAVVRHGGKQALTRYRVVESLANGRLARIECRLATGRTHQIRVHLASIGHPLVGDPVYGRSAGRRREAPPALQEALSRFERQALDAVVLGFSHPRTGARLRFTRAPSRDVQDLVAALRAG